MKFKKIVPFLLVGMISTTTINVYADDISTVKTEITNLQSSLSETTNQITNLDNQVNTKNQEIEKLINQIKSKESENNSLTDAISVKDNQLKEMNANTDYKDLLANSKMHEEKLDKMSEIKTLIDIDQNKITENKEDISEITNEKTTMENEKTEIEKNKETLEQQKNNLETQIQQKQTIVDKYNKEQEEKKKAEEAKKQAQTTVNPSWSGSVLSKSKGVNIGPSGKETYYNLNMSGVVNIMRSQGYSGEYWVRSDGCKMLGNYIMVAANLGVHPRGSLVQTSLGTGIVCDTGGFASGNANQLDIATTW